MANKSPKPFPFVKISGGTNRAVVEQAERVLVGDLVLGLGHHSRRTCSKMVSPVTGLTPIGRMVPQQTAARIRDR
jgi:hypothetical protein